jgi:hypothetical protein
MGRRETGVAICSPHENRFEELILFKTKQYFIIKLYIYKKIYSRIKC